MYICGLLGLPDPPTSDEGENEMAMTANPSTNDLRRPLGRMTKRPVRGGIRRAGVMVWCALAFATAGLAQLPTSATGAPRTDEAAAQVEKAPRDASAQSWLQTLNIGELRSQNTPFNWLVLLGAIVVGVVLGKALSVVLTRVGKRITQGRRFPGSILTYAAGPAYLLVEALGLQAGLAQIAMSDPLAKFCANVIVLLIHIAFFWYVFNLVGLVEAALHNLTRRTASDMDDMLVPLVRKSLRIFVVVLGFLLVSENVFGQDIGAWLAGFGIAGLAVSLAAQDTLKNIFGSITILFDRPFKVGDRVIYGGYDGPVEEIGFRSTKIRTLTGHLVTVPNSRIVSDPVENVGARPSIRRILNVTVTYDTPPEKLRQAVKIIRDILEEPGIAEPVHGKIGKDEYPPRIAFNDFNAASLNILVIYWYFPPDYWDYLEHSQRVNMRLLEEFNAAGIEFAFPTQTLYLAGDAKRELAVRMLGPEKADGGGAAQG
jgi:MscS family membrane protein